MVRSRPFPRPLLLALTALAAVSCSRPAEPVESQRQAMSPPRTRLRLSTSDANRLRAELSREGVDVLGALPRQGVVEVLVDEAEVESLLSRHASRVLGHQRLPLPAAPAGYRTPADVAALLEKAQADYPAIARAVDLSGPLFEGGRIWALKLSDHVEADEDEPTFVMDGQIHAREVMTSEVCLDAIEYLTTRYGSDPEVTRLLDSMEIWILPVLNPDGSTYLAKDSGWRKNRHPKCAVDLNRNFAWNFGQCPINQVCSRDDNAGTSAGSEPETQALTRFFDEVRPTYYLTYHSFGEYLLWPSGCGRTDDQDLFAVVGQELNERLENDDGQTGRWEIGSVTDVLYQAPGGSDDQAYGAFGAIAFTVELNQEFQPAFLPHRGLTVRRQRAGWLHLMRRTLDGPAVRGHVADGASGAPLRATYSFLARPFRTGQSPLQADQAGRFGRAVLAGTHDVLAFTAPGYLPALREVQIGRGPLDLTVDLTPGTNRAPVAAASGPASARIGEVVRLDAALSSDPDGGALFFKWTQLSGPAVQLAEPWSARPSFEAPRVGGAATLTFQVVATDGELSSGPATVSVVVEEGAALASADVPKPIPDGASTGATSVLAVPRQGRILALEAKLLLSHPAPRELRVELTSPRGVREVLADGTVAQAGAVGLPGPAFRGEEAAGDWTVRVVDSKGGNAGTLEGWSLALTLVGPCAEALDCALPRATAACEAGQCRVSACESGWGDCDGEAWNGCEADLEGDAGHCGGCAGACRPANAPGACWDGACSFASCSGAFRDCDGEAGNGCEADIQTDASHCGGCGRACASEHGQARCVNGACTLSCQAPFKDCDLDAANGCEADLTIDARNCGACGSVCPPAHAAGRCEAGTCALEGCLEPWLDCDGSRKNGCEANPTTSLAHCGGCGRPCSFANATALCQGGECSMGACRSSWADCNEDPADGCEADLRTPGHCGACGVTCAFANAEARCVVSSCQLGPCAAGFADCDEKPENGCEASLASAEHCGACGKRCAPGEQCREGQCLPDADADGHFARSAGGDDCDDGNPAINPLAGEVCNDLDDDCDGQADEGDACSWFGCSSAPAGPGLGSALLALLGLAARRGPKSPARRGGEPASG